MTLQRAVQILNKNKHRYKDDNYVWEMFVETDPPVPDPEQYDWLDEEQVIKIAEQYERKSK